MENTPRPYVLTLLRLMGDQEGADKENPPLGMAICWETQSSVYSLPAHRLLLALIEHPPTPEADQAIAQEFLTELAKCENSAVIELGDALSTLSDPFYVEYYVRVHSLKNEDPPDPSDWAAAVFEGISEKENTSPLTDLANRYVNELVIPIVNPAGKRTPAAHTDSQASTGSETPQVDIANQASDELLQSAIHRDQGALKELVLRRDGDSCLLTKFDFVGECVVTCHCAHILPFSVGTKTHVHKAIEMFTGNEVEAKEIQPLINHPANAMNLQGDAHVSLDQHLAWGIEAKQINNEWKYYFRVVRKRKVLATIRLKDGDEIEFGKGVDGKSIQHPDPRICNLRLAIARVFAASGFAELVDRFFEDWNDPSGEVNFGDELLRQLALSTILSS